MAGCSGSSGGGKDGGAVGGNHAGGHGGTGTGGHGGTGTGGAGTGGAGTGGAGSGGSGTGGAGTGSTNDGGAGTGAGGSVDAAGDVPISGAGGSATDAGSTDAGIDAAPQTVLYDFENGLQGWGWNGVAGATAVVSTEQAFDGAQSLKASLAPAPEGGTPPSATLIEVNNTALWPGTLVTFHAFFPVGTPTGGNVYVQSYTQSNNFHFIGSGNSAHSIVPGGWTTWTYTIPNTFPGGLQRLGVQIGDNSGGLTIAGKSIYIDAINATGGVQNCAVATGTGLHDFEPVDGGAVTLDPNVYGLDNFPSNANIALSASPDQAFTGVGSMKVAFTGLPASTTGQLNVRNLFIAYPNIYCGQTATFHVFMPTGSDGVTFGIFVQYNNYARSVPAVPQTITRNAWNTFQYTVPADVGPGGIQRIAVQFVNNRGTADAGAGDGGTDGGGTDGGSITGDYTGNVYIDAVTW